MSTSSVGKNQPRPQALSTDTVQKTDAPPSPGSAPAAAPDASPSAPETPPLSSQATALSKSEALTSHGMNVTASLMQQSLVGKIASFFSPTVEVAKTGIGDAARRVAAAAAEAAAKGAEAPAPAGPPADVKLTGIPPRADDAMSGSDFSKKIANLPQAKREAAILEEIDKGNIPESMRTLKPVTYTATTKSGEQKEVKMYVMPDYISIGSDKDSLRVPMTPQTAQKIADKMGCSLPTRKMVDEVYAHADRKVTFEQVATPRSLTAGKSGDELQAAVDKYHVSNDGLIKHDAAVDKAVDGTPPGALVAGHKKDIIIGEPVAPGHVGIYGAYDQGGKPIHAFNVGSHAHGDFYVDYSHGARMVNNTVYVDGKPMPLDQLLQDENMAPLVGPGKSGKVRY